MTKATDPAQASRQSDAHWMRRALSLAHNGRYSCHPNPAVGCVIVKDGEVIGEGFHAQAGAPHAEINAIADAKKRGHDSIAGADVFVTLEPCAHTGRTGPCADALVAQSPARVVAAMADPNPQVAGQGFARLQSKGIETHCGLMESEARALNPGFCHLHESGRPFLRLKLAASLDGRTAMANGESQWITGEQARSDVQRLRAESSAVLTGIETVLADDPAFTVRAREFLSQRQPVAVVLDTHSRIQQNAKLAQRPETLIYSKTGTAVGQAESVKTPCIAGKLDLNAVLTDLAQRQLHTVLVECGPTLAGALLQSGHVDELVIYLAPKLMGNAARGLFHLPGLDKLAEAPDLQICDVRAIGGDWRIIARPSASPLPQN